MPGMEIANGPVSLDYIPLELLLLIFDTGQLSTREAIALRSTCSRLLSAIDTRSLWFLIASRAQPLQFPAFRPISSLSLHELRRACVRAFHCRTNLESPNPVVRSRRTFQPGIPESVTHFAFLPGGYYALIAFTNGCTRLWSLSQLSSAMGHAASGSFLAQHDNKEKGPIGGFYFRTFGEDERLIVVSTLSTKQRHLTVFGFKLEPDDSVRVEEYVTLTTVMSDPVPALGPFGLLAVIEGSFAAGSARVLLVDYLKQVMLLIDSGLPNTAGQSQYDIVLTQSSDLVIFRGGETGWEFNAYFDVPDILHTRGYDVKPVPTEHPVLLHPDVSRPFTFPEDGRFKHHSPWYTNHPWNTPCNRTYQQTQITSVSSYNGDEEAEDGHIKTMTSQWVDMEQIARSLKIPGSASPLQGGRNFCHLYEDVAINFEYGWLWFVGSAGTYVVWVAQVTEGASPDGMWPGPTMFILKLPSNDDDPAPIGGRDIQDKRRILELPVDIILSDVSIMDFCDESGVLAVCAASEEYGSQVVLLQY